jgi:hypothetical protein
VNSTLKHLRPLLIGIVALLFTAGIAFAGKPAATGLANAAVHAGKTVPVVAEPSDEEGDEDLDEPAETEETDESDGGENCATDPTDLTPEELAGMTHGSIVCWAAHQETPEGFDNHGAWVSSWAKQNHGHEEDAASGHGKSKKHLPPPVSARSRRLWRRLPDSRG